MHAPVDRKRLERFGRMLAEVKRRKAKKEQSQRGYYDDNGVRQGGLIAFVRYFWSVLEPETPFVDGWPLWAMCQHLEAVSFGEITRLLINVPPGFMKSMLVDVFWPAFEWGPLGKSHYRYVTFSYSASLTERDNDRFRTLIASAQYQALYGPLKTTAEYAKGGVGLRNKTITKVMNTATGWKLASSVGGVGTGERGDRVIIDDPHNVVEAESEIERANVIRWFRESVSSRFNDLRTGALIIIMQRVHEGDVSGTALSPDFDYCHLMIPWEYDSSRQQADDGNPIETAISWFDPREEDGEVAWAERFSADAMDRTHREVGPYAWAAQYQQSPAPRGGGIFKREWWQLWESEDNKFPLFDFVVASLDGAFTEKEENDPSALTVWGVWTKPGFSGGEVDERTGTLWEAQSLSQQKIMLVHAWRKHLQFSAPRIERKPNETNAAYRHRTQPSWGLIEWVHDTCLRFKVDRLLIEAKASGISAAQEIQNRFGRQPYGIQLVQVKGDKVARALAVQPTMSQGLVYAPDRDWAEMVIDEAEVFPKGRYLDLTDSMTQALKWLRDGGLAQTADEIADSERERVMHRPRQKALYPV